MLASVFNRKKVQERLNNLTQTRRVASPPSPASFESPEIVDINDKASTSNFSQFSDTGSTSQHSPQVQLNLRRSESISDWFPADLLRGDPIEPPERNVSLAKTSLTTVNGISRVLNTSNSHEGFEGPLDEVIVIEAEHKSEVTEQESSSLAAQDGIPESTPSQPRKAAPAPIKIPDVTSERSRPNRSRSNSASGAQGSSAEGSGSGSRPLSTYSDIVSSAVSGTTIARALVANSFIVTNNARQSTWKGVTRQDSATLPKGEHPFLTSPYWRDKRISKGEIVSDDSSVPPVPPMPERNRRNSASASVAEARRQSEARLNGILSPDSAASSASSSSSRLSRTGSLTRVHREQFVGRRVSTISEASSLPSPKTPTLNIRDSSSAAVQSNGPVTERQASASTSSLHHEGISLHSQKHQDASPVPSHASLPHPQPSPQPSPRPSLAPSVSSLYSPHSAYTHTTEESGQESASLATISPNPNMHRSTSDRGSARNTPNRPVIVVPPLSDRPHSVPVSASPISPDQKGTTLALSGVMYGESPMDSPDWLDIVPRSAMIMNEPMLRRPGQPPPINVPTNSGNVVSPDTTFSTETSTSDSERQTFPETPYAFSPLITGSFVPPQLPNQPKHSPRMASLSGWRGRPLPSRSLFRSASSGATGLRKVENADEFIPDVPDLPSAALSAIEETTSPNSQQASVPADQQTFGIDRSISSPESGLSAYIDQKPAVDSPNTSSPSTSESLSQPSSTFSLSSPPAIHSSSPTTSPGPSLSAQSSVHDVHSSEQPAGASATPSGSPMMSVDNTLTHSPHLLPSDSYDINELVTASPRNSSSPNGQLLPSYYEEPQPLSLSSGPSPPPYRSNPLSRDSTSSSFSLSKVMSRNRPNPPTGPRRPSAPSHLSVMRARNGSVTSLHSNSSRHPGPSSASAPKFQTSAITLRGLTLEQAQWTLTSEELQSVVSKSIKDWAADPTAVRVLHPRVLHDQLGDEKRKLETQSIELRTNYKLAVRKRRGLATALSNAVELVDTQDHASLSRMMDELKELGDQMDRIAEELYAVTDQQMQLRHLEDVHHSSALGMALRKLNTSFIKHMQDNSALRHRIAELEAERDEGWAHAQEIAQELEAKDPNSGRAGKVTFARKASVRASKAGLRSPNRRRSQRSSAHSSIRSSGMFSPRSAVDDIPPVPPIPSRKSLGIITDLPFRSPGMVSDGSPSSEARALLEAQRELCDMLGISLDEFAPPRRRLSTSDVGATSASGSGSAQLRRNSLITTPARTKDEQRAYVLASIGMTPHEI